MNDDWEESEANELGPLTPLPIPKDVRKDPEKLKKWREWVGTWWRWWQDEQEEDKRRR